MHRIYHSGETEDASWFLRWLNANLVMRQRLPSAIRSAVISGLFAGKGRQ